MAEQIGGMVSISTPIFFRNSRIHLVPIIKVMKRWHDVRKLGTHTDPEAHNRYHSYRRLSALRGGPIAGPDAGHAQNTTELTTAGR